MREKIYMDHAATTPMHPEVIQTLTAAMEQYYGNPSSVHGVGREVRKVIDEARQLIAQSIHAHEQEIIFNSGGTEGDNMIIALAQALADKGRHIITTAVEHPAIIKSTEYLSENGFEITYLPVDERGRLNLDDLKNSIRPDTTIVSVIMVNNELGNVYPIQEIGEYLADKDIIFHTDAVQGFPLLDIDVKELHIDMLSVSAHKFNGPKGVGFLYYNINLPYISHIHGGDQERKRRAGTENTPGILAMAKAVEILNKDRKKNRDDVMGLRQYFIEQLDAAEIAYKINGDPENTAGHILNLHLKGQFAEHLMIRLDLNGIAVSAGSACSAGNVEPSHVLVALYKDPENAAISESLRFSMGATNTKDEIDKVVAILKNR